MNQHLFAGALALAALVTGCGTTREARMNDARMDDSALKTSKGNPLLAPWTGPYGGVPPLDKVEIRLFKPALEAAMEEERREIAAIADEAEPPSFENTVAAFENAGRTLNNVSAVFGIWSSVANVPEFQSVEREMAPVLAAFADEIFQNQKLFARLEAVYQSPEKAKLTPEQQRLVWVHYTNFVHAGAKLDAAAKKRLVELNQRLASLFTDFNQRVLADEETAIVLDSEAELAGLPDSVKQSAAAAAETRGLKGKWAITNTRSFMEPFLTYSTRRDLREKVWRTYVDRGDHGDAHDTKALITEILSLRAERAKLLGFPTHAHWRMENSMAKTPERALELMEAVWRPAVARVREEVADMQAIADREGQKLTIEPWDYRFYAEKVRKAKYDLDQGEVTQYLQLEKMREAMFWVAGELFGFDFAPVTNVPVNHPDVRVYEVKDRASGKQVGLWYFDPYARTGKRSGAWMNAYRNQERFRGEITTLVSNNSNFLKAAPGQPVLLSWDEAETMFHEFGHALHGLNSNVAYPTLSGTNVVRDFVEFPSQLLEHWLPTPEVLSRFALNAQTGKPIPPELVAKLKKAATFNQGFLTTEYLSAALVDMKIHLAGKGPVDPHAFEVETLQALGMPSQLVMRHRTPQFSHIFSSDDYSAGYYSYLWSDTLTTDAFEAFTEKKGPYDPEVASKLKTLFSAGNTVDPAECYRAFRGRDPSIDALMRDRGFPVVATREAPKAKPGANLSKAKGAGAKAASGKKAKKH